MEDDNFKLTKEETIIYDNIDDVGDNDNLGYLKPNVQNINHAVEHDDYDDDGYNALLSAELMLPNEAADGFIRGTVIK